MIDATRTQRMQEATRLTRAGKLTEAMRVLQGGAPGADDPEPASTETGNVFDSTCEVKARIFEPFEAPHQPHAFDWRQQWAGMKGGATSGDDAPERLAPATPGAFTAGRFANRIGARDYKLYTPSGYQGQPLALVVMLHGCTQNPDDFAAGTAMNRQAEEQTFCVLYPAQPASANTSKCWNWFKAQDQARDGGEPELLAGMTRQVLDAYHLDASRVFVAGLSAGAAMATTLAMTYPELYAAVGVHSGLPHGVAKSLPDALAAMQGGQGATAVTKGQECRVPAIVFHGDRDTTVHPKNAERVAAQYAASRLGATTEQGASGAGQRYTRRVHRDGQGVARLEQWTLHGAGHAWAGGSASGSYTDPRGVEASREMLRFFFAQPHYAQNDRAASKPSRHATT
ncbi:alpha/beta hydrolase family esterase [Halomonas sp. GD1P12]|uniref:extracellular catalytic domain type 1 short-chain-length polyhydroxyalkanoate depolymerase n=1 Tax=Halomonas sp. GD1P12 TaxID=2982691 RepID=UPI0021E3BCB9|nr:PHB depolymerase family esterase [Halomonas sp. GD1P12]UYG00942.1 PHB depolymerase family esterase [Halomonas sp. GD1P12]